MKHIRAARNIVFSSSPKTTGGLNDIRQRTVNIEQYTTYSVTCPYTLKTLKSRLSHLFVAMFLAKVMQFSWQLSSKVLQTMIFGLPVSLFVPYLMKSEGWTVNRGVCASICRFVCLSLSGITSKYMDFMGILVMAQGRSG